MRKSLMICLCCASILSTAAETLNVTVGSITYSAPTEVCGDMFYSGGETLTILGKDFELTQIDGMTVDESDVKANTIVINYDSGIATATIDARIARYVDVNINGADVSIVQHDNVSAENCGEITYILAGNSAEGTFNLTGNYKTTVVLNGLTLSSNSGAAINIQNGKRIKLKLTDGTTNTITDGISGSQKGCLVCKGHLEIQGNGILEVNARSAHAIYSKEYVTLEDATIRVLNALKDGLNCNQYFSMKSGTLEISGVGDDGIQVSYKDDTDRDEEDTGSISISGGKLDIKATATAAKAIKADGDILISDGVITASVSGGGTWDSSKLKTKASTCISSDGNMIISGGKIRLTATGCAGKGISVDGDLEIDGGDITVSTSGGMFVYINGKEYSDYTGNTDRIDSDCKSSPKGIKADGNVTIKDGTINVTTIGNGGEGIESKAVMIVSGGNIVINSYDDGLNTSGHMYIRGGDITVVATNNDAIDSNGNMYIQGGYIRAFGASAPECGIDANEEEGYTVIFTGGTLIAAGGNNSVPTTSESTQPYVSGNTSLTAGSTVSLKSGDEVLATFQIPDNYKAGTGGTGGGGPGGWGPGGGGPGGNGNSSVLITCDGLTSGNSYTMTSGSSSTTVKAQLTGNGGGRPW